MPQRTDEPKTVYGPSKLAGLAKLFRTMQIVSKAIFDKTQRGTLPAPTEPCDAKPK